MVVPVVIDAHLENIFAFIVDIWREVESECHNAIVAGAHLLTIEIYRCRKACALELYHNPPALHLPGQAKMLGIDHHRIAQLAAVARECFRLIKGIRQGDIQLRRGGSDVLHIT